MTLYIHLFGQPRLLLHAQPLKWSAPPQTLPLLAYLLLHRWQAIERRQLAFALWPDEPEAAARANLRRHLYQLQRALPAMPPGRPWLLSDGQTLGWNPQADFWLDVAEFERLSAQPAGLEEAAACYGGDLLETVYDDWALFERERLRALYFDVLTRLAVQHRAARSYDKAMGFVRQCLARDPFREDMVRQLIALRYELGDRAGAIQEYHAFERLLRQEMGVAPMPETRALHDIVLRGTRLPDEGNVEPAAAGPGPARPAAPALLPFVGREAEMGRAIACWSRAARGRGGLLLVGGEAGVGKTRLAHELAQLVESQEGRSLAGDSDPGRPRPYGPIAAALESALALIAASGLDLGRLAALAALLPALRQHKHLPVLPPLVPERERTRLFDAVAACLEQLARPRPLLLVVENLHWAEETTIALLELVTRRVAQHPILILGTYRQEETPRAHPLRALRRRLQAQNLGEHLALGCLSSQAVAALVARLTAAHLPLGPSLSPLEARLYAESEGHPLFIELLVQQWRETGQIEPGALPGGVRAAISRRLEGLPGPARAYAELAAVAGLAFDAEVVREVGGWDETQALAALGTLLDRRLVRDVESRSRCDYVLAYHLIQSVLYVETPAARLRRRHRRTAEVLEELYPEQRSERAGELAHHYDRGGDAARAVDHYLAAARQWQQVFADAEALAALDRALALARAPSPLPPRTLFDLLLLRESIYCRRGERAGQLTDLQELEQLSAAVDDPERAIKVAARHVVYYRLIDDRPAQKAAVETLERQARALGSRRWQAQAVFDQAYYQKIVNDFPGAIAGLQDALALYRELGDVVGQGLCCCLLAETFTLNRQSVEAEAWARQALALCRDETPAEQLMNTLWNLAANGLTTGDLERCHHYAHQLLDTAERAGDRHLEAAARRLLGMACQRQFRIAEARQHLAAAFDLYRLIQKPKGRALTLQSLGSVELSLGRYPAAQDCYQQAFDIQAGLDDRLGMASEAVNLSFVAALQRDYAAAGSHARVGLALARQIQNRFLEATALQNLGEAQRETGDPGAACQTLEQALALLDDPALARERCSVLADLVLARWSAGDRGLALQSAEQVLALYPGVEGTDDNVHRYLWAAARVLRAAGQAERAGQALAQAYRTFQDCLAAIPDAESRQVLALIAHNRQITAAYERGEWPPDQAPGVF